MGKSITPSTRRRRQPNGQNALRRQAHHAEPGLKSQAKDADNELDYARRCVCKYAHDEAERQLFFGQLGLG